MTYKFTTSQLGYLQSSQRKSAFVGGIGSGKSYCSTFSAINRARGGRRVLFVLPTFSMIRDAILPLVTEHLVTQGLSDGVHYNLVTSPLPTLTLGTGTVMFRSAEMGNRLRGINADDLYMDEISYIDRPVYDICLGRVRKSTNAHIRLSSTPNGEESWMFEELIANGSDWDLHRQTTLSNPFIPREYKEDLIKSYGKDSAFFRQEILGEFISTVEADQIININVIGDAAKRPFSHGEKIASLDIARFGNDSSAFALLDGNHFTDLDTVNGLSGTELLGWVMSKYVIHGFKRLIVDAAGLGGEWIDFAKEKMPGIEFIEFNGGHSAKDKKSYANSRAESWGHLVQAMENWASLIGVDSGTIITIKKQMKGIRKFYNDKGQTQLMSKAQLRTKGVLSPDLCDSMSMACWLAKAGVDNREVASKLYKNIGGLKLF